jgi:3-hydroxyisobutyrate dehydrogenase-like beta-hydroxyacid dehydrogenase
MQRQCAPMSHAIGAASALGREGLKEMQAMSSVEKQSVGVIGLGIMGGAIARNLAAAGWHVVGYDTDPARSRELTDAGVEIAKSPVEVARAAGTILTSLPKPEALMATVEAIAAAGLPRRILAELSTFTIEDKEAAEDVLRKAGHVLLDCPLSGTGSQAKAKDLVIYASGDSQAIAALSPVFSDFGRKTHDLGAFGNGMKMKFVANLLVAIHNVASAEAMVLGMKAGLNPHRLYELVTSGAGNSRVFELRAGMMADNRYDGDNVTMKVSIWQKDMKVIGDYAQRIGAPTPTFSATEAIYNAAMSTGHAGDDTAAVCAVLETMAGLSRR